MLTMLAIMLRFLLRTINILLFILVCSTTQSQKLFSDAIGESGYEHFLRKKLEDFSPNDRFDYVISQYDGLVRNSMDSLEVLSEVYADYLENSMDSMLYSYIVGGRLFRVGDVNSAILYLEKSSIGFLSAGKYQLSSQSYNDLGNAWFTLGKFDAAVSSYISSLKVGHESDDETAKFNAFIGLGRSYCAVGDTSIGLKLLNNYYTRSLQFNKSEAISDVCGALAVVYQDLGDKQMAEYFFKRSFDYALKSSSISMKANAYTNKAILDLYKGDIEAAKMGFEHALEARLKFGSHRPIVDSYFNLASFHILQEDYSSAITYIQKALKISKADKMIVEEIDLKELLAEVYVRIKQFDKVKAINEELRKLKEQQRENKEIDPLSTGGVSLMLDNHSTKPVDIKQKDHMRYIRILSVFALLIFSVVFLIKSRPNSI